jgi:hypothetical protein
MNLLDALVAALGKQLSTHPRLAVLAPSEHPVLRAPSAAGLKSRAGARLIAVAGGARSMVGAGLVLGGRPAVTLLSSGDAQAPPPGGPHVLVAPDGETAGALWAQGIDVLQPSWPADVAPLLAAALTGARPVVLRVDARSPAAALGEVPPLVAGAHRVLRSGAALGLYASGAGVPTALTVARMLAGRGVDAAAIEVSLLPAGRGITPARTDEVLMLGPAPRPGEINADAVARLRTVPLAGDRAVLEAVLSRRKAPGGT